MEKIQDENRNIRCRLYAMQRNRRKSKRCIEGVKLLNFQF